MSKLVLLRDPLLSECFPQTMDATHAVMLGNPDTGRPMPAEQIRAVTMISNRG
jgi:hypothetical protein